MIYHVGNGWDVDFLDFIIIAAVLVIWWMVVPSLRAGRSRENPEEILKRRYVSGEIDKAEYERKLMDLRR